MYMHACVVLCKNMNVHVKTNQILTTALIQVRSSGCGVEGR